VLRRFGLALARDDRFVFDPRSALVLVENLAKRASLAVRNDGGGDERLRLFRQFILLYRRHVRMAAAEDRGCEMASRSASGPPDHDSSLVARAVRNLPLELRESLLLVVLEQFSHIEAAEALDIPLATLIDRLNRGRRLLTAEFTQRRSLPLSTRLRDRSSHRGVSHLRLVK
jgi:hypothetical protein